MNEKTQKIIDTAEALCIKFINKVETGNARSKETYQECIDLLSLIRNRRNENKNE